MSVQFNYDVPSLYRLLSPRWSNSVKGYYDEDEIHIVLVNIFDEDLIPEIVSHEQIHKDIHENIGSNESRMFDSVGGELYAYLGQRRFDLCR